MGALTTAAGYAAIYAANVLIMYLLAWFLTEKIRLVQVKPFNCRACMAFWLTFLAGVVLAFVLESGAPGRWFLVGWAFLTALINYLYINAKFKIYE